MAIAATVITMPGSAAPIEASGNMWIVFATLAFSGSYTTNGDAFDPATLFIGPAGGISNILMVDISGGPGVTFEYDKTNKKIKVFSSANTELAAGAYNAALTGDGNIVLQAWGK